MQHPVVPSSFSSIKLEAYPAHLQQHPAISFDYNYNYHPNQQLLPPPDSNNMAKRALSDSDCEDLFTDTKDRLVHFFTIYSFAFTVSLQRKRKLKK